MPRRTCSRAWTRKLPAQAPCGYRSRPLPRPAESSMRTSIRLPQRLLAATCLAVLAGCSGPGNSAPVQQSANEPTGPFLVDELGTFQEPWAMAFLPDGRLLVTEKAGTLQLVDADGNESVPVAGVPEVAYGGQGGLGDVALHPDFAENGLLYVSYAESGDADTRGAAVARARLVLGEDGPALADVEVVWRQVPKVRGQGHYAHRLLFGPDGHLWISSGDRQK